jgi:hypothetical protein
MNRKLALALLLFAVALPTSASAQVKSNLPRAGFDTSSTAAATPAPTLRVYSRETIVDVTVTDSSGNPVHGLTRDFTIKEDSHPQPIRSFREDSISTTQGFGFLFIAAPSFTRAEPLQGPRSPRSSAYRTGRISSRPWQTPGRWRAMGSDSPR